MNVAAADMHEAGRCEWERSVAAYLDGELDADASGAFEAHAKECAPCAAALREQRRLLCLLDNAFDETFERKVALPPDFTRVVKARAQTDMSGVRERRERTISLKICVGLACAIFALLGAPSLEALAPAADAARAAAGVVGVSAGAAADAGSGALVIARGVGSRLVADSHLHALLQWLLFGFVLALLLLLIGRYHRGARAND